MASNYFDKASLVMIPDAPLDGKVLSVKPEDRSGDFTFTRGSNLAATRVDVNGLIEKGRENLLLQSNQFDTTWLTTRSSVTGGQSGYDGSNDAWKITGTNPADGLKDHYLRQSYSATGVLTISGYFKAAEKNTIRILFNNSDPTPRADFDLANGSVHNKTNVVDASIVDVGNGWYRCSVTGTLTTNAVIQIYATESLNATAWIGDDTSGVYIQDAQLESGLVATDYIETGATTAQAGILEDLPRLDYTDSSCPALLLEPLRTNLVPISEGVPENSTAVTLTRNYGTSPEGVQNSLKVQKLGVNSNDRIYPIDNYNATLVSGNKYSLSAFVKNIDVDGITTIGCRLGSGGTLFRLGYEWNGSSLTKSTLYGNGTRTNELLEDYGNGWWRIGFTFEAGGTQANIEIDIDRDNGSNTTSIETWGWQLESATGDASYATSYIPTYGSAVTRSLDVSSLGGLQTSSILNGTTGTFLFEGINKNNQFYCNFVITTDGSNTNRSFLIDNSGGIRLRVWNASSGIDANISAATALGVFKYLIRWDNGNLEVFLNGASVGTATINAYSYTTINLKEGAFSNNLVNQVLTFPTALTDSECIALTTI